MFYSRFLFVFVFFCNCLFVYGRGDTWSTRSDSKELKQLRKNTRVSKTPCTCDEDTATCTCCANVGGEEGCASFRAPNGKSRNQIVKYDFAFSDQTTTTMSPVGVDPPPLCVNVLGGFVVEACASFEANIIDDSFFQACTSLVANVGALTTVEVDLDCAELYIGASVDFRSKNHDPAYHQALYRSQLRRQEIKKHRNPRLKCKI